MVNILVSTKDAENSDDF